MSVYRVTEIIGTSSTSWEDAAAEAIRTAAGTTRPNLSFFMSFTPLSS